MRKTFPPTIFTLEIDGKPTLAFEAAHLRQAHELSRVDWLRNDLGGLHSNGVPLYRVGDTLRVRVANEIEQAIYHDGAQKSASSDELIMVYLVELDDGGADDRDVDPGEFPPTRNT